MLYQSDAATFVQIVPATLTNVRSLNSRRDANDFTQLKVAAGTAIAAGQTVQHSGLWYVVYKVLVQTAMTLKIECMLLPLPYTLTVTRVQPAGVPMVRNGYGEPRQPSNVSETTRTILAGFSNDNDPLSVADLGQMPRGVLSCYTPLGSDVQLKDQVTLPPDGRLAVVQQKNLIDANGTYIGYQLLVDAAGGIGAL